MTARLVRPVAGSAKKVYIAHGRAGTPVSLSGSRGEGVEIVDSRAAADEVVTVYVGSAKVGRSEGRRLAKACREEQERQRHGEEDEGVFDQIVADLEAPPWKPAAEQEGGGLRFRNALALAGLMWVGLAVYLLGEEGIGVGLVALLLGLAMVPACAVLYKFIDLFLPGGLVGLAALALAGLTWAAALGFVDVEKQNPRRVAPDPSGSAASTVERSREGSPPVVDGADDWDASADAYTVIVASKAARRESAAFVARLPAWARPAGILRSDDYTTLLPGYWVAFGGRFSSVEAALDAAERLRRAGFAGAYAELISRRPRDPAGTITAASIGSIRVGMSMREVRRHVTPPDLERTIGFASGPPREVDPCGWAGAPGCSRRGAPAATRH